MRRRIKIVSTGAYVPRTRVPSSEIDAKLGKRAGWTERLFGISQRYYAASGETTSAMAASAAGHALERAGLSPGDLDCVLSACGVGEQPIPCTAALIQNKLGLGNSGIPAYDVNATCLSFVAALDAAADAIALGRYRRVLIAAADIASCGLDWSNPEAAAIFGDGAAAAIVEAAPPDDPAVLLASRIETYGTFQDVCRLEAGGTRLSPFRPEDRFLERTNFHMDGAAALACVQARLPGFLEKLLASASVRLNDIDVLILHQASAFSLKAVQQQLALPADKLVYIFKDFGNQIATSIPHTLDHAVRSGRLKRGDLALLLGTSAGISFGGSVLRY